LIPPAHSRTQEVLEAAVFGLLGGLKNAERSGDERPHSQCDSCDSVSVKSVSPRPRECVIELRDGFHAALLRDLAAVHASPALLDGVPGVRFARRGNDVLVIALNPLGRPAGQLLVRHVPKRYWTRFQETIEKLMAAGSVRASPVINESSVKAAQSLGSPLPVTAGESSAISNYQRQYGDLARLGSQMLRRIGVLDSRHIIRDPIHGPEYGHRMPDTSKFPMPLFVVRKLLHPVAGFVHACSTPDVRQISKSDLLEIAFSTSTDPEGACLVMSSARYPLITRRAQSSGRDSSKTVTAEGGSHAS
jgi:hypothetical protein